MADSEPIKHNWRFQDLTGQKFGRLLVLKYSGLQSTKPLWECRCDCGNIVLVISQNLKRGGQVSCGCLRREDGKNKTHGMASTKNGVRPEYTSWQHAKDRCINPRNKYFASYGGRGIQMCDEWINSFDAFYQHIGPQPNRSYTLDRINNDGHYEPGNVRWATRVEQNNNRRPRRWKVKPKAGNIL